MKKICFSLWGNDTRYTLGAIRNAELAKIIYPSWVCRYYVSSCVSDDIIKKLESFDNTEIIKMGVVGDWTGMFWRFCAASDDGVEVMISRDTDSRLTVRESHAVKEWLESDKNFHIMRDHPYHRTEILGGMWGVRSGKLPNMEAMIKTYVKGDFWQVDQNFLREKVWPIIKDDVYTHDEYFGNVFGNTNPYYFKRDPKHFIGQAYNGEDKILDDNEYFIDNVLEKNKEKI